MTNVRRQALDTLLAFKVIALSDTLSGTEKRVTATIVDSFNHKTTQCDPSLNCIAHLLELDRRTVIRAVKRVEHQRFLRKKRYGGRFHRNSYEPNWLLYRALEGAWAARKRTRHWGVPEMSPGSSQNCHPTGAPADTQTFPINQSNKPSARDPACHGGDGKSASCGQTTKEERRAILTPEGSTRFRTATRSRAAAATAAERRWNRALHEQFSSSPEVYAQVIGAIDDAMQCAATAAEIKRHGAGVAYILEQLRAQGFEKPLRNTDAP